MPFARVRRCFLCLALSLSLPLSVNVQAEQLELPLGRTNYFVGELVPIAWPAAGETKLEAIGADGAVLLYQGGANRLLIDTAKLAPGDYRLRLGGVEMDNRFRIVPTLRRSAGSMQDESQPQTPQYPPQPQTPEERRAFEDAHWKKLSDTLDATRLTAFVPMAQADVDRMPWLDVAARNGVLVLPNPDTRPSSFFPVGNDPAELDSMSQRMILGAQANGRYPNFGGYMIGWDTTGYAIGNRRGLLTYWGWGDKTDALRHYLAQIDKQTEDEFRRRTKLEPVKEAEYIAYLLSIQRPEFATLIDLPTRHWLQEIAAHTKPMPEAERIQFEQRLDIWSAYLMNMYGEAYAKLGDNLRTHDASLKNSASVQVDHAPVRYGQYFPTAYKPLDFCYQSTWNDQVGGPDYAYQWLFTAGLLDMHRNGKPTWLSNAMGPVHARANYPGKFMRVAAHGLPWGVTGIGFALEGFSNITGGMNRESNWHEIAGKAGGADVLAGREFIDRFASLATHGRGDHGVAIVFSKSQYQRQHLAMGFGTTPYLAFVSLTRLGYTPRFVTEEELVAAGGKIPEPTILIAGQTFPFPANVNDAIKAYQAAGGAVIVDDGSTIEIADAKKLGYAFSFTRLGKPHNWAAPNMPAGENDSLMLARWHAELAPKLAAAIGPRGKSLLSPERGAASDVSLLQIDGGADAKYLIAVNDSFIKTQADWYQVLENLQPTRDDATGLLYDCTQERDLGKLAALACDLRETTARVFAVTTRPVDKIQLAATQKVTAGDTCEVSAAFADAEGKRLAALVPFCLQLVRPNGEVLSELYRSTDREGNFQASLPLPINVPAGKWQLRLRCQLNGKIASLPIEVGEAKLAADTLARDAATETTVVRQKDAIDAVIAAKPTFLLPIFDSPDADKLQAVAEKVKAELARVGVGVDIVRGPKQTTYTLAYQLTAEQQTENALADRGEALGKIKRETVNGNDWYSAVSGWRCLRPLLLLDVAGEKGDNPVAESLHAAGLLWPEVTANHPGAGRAIVEGVRWAFAPRVTSIVIRASDIVGLEAGAAALAKLPEDRLTAPIAAVKSELWRQHHIGNLPAEPARGALTSDGLALAAGAQPLAMQFPGERPPAADAVARPARPTPPVVEIPAKVGPGQFVIFVSDGDKFAESATAEMLVPDLRFSDAIQIVVDVKEAGKYRVTALGTFRYSDRKPCWQAQWEDIIELREKLVPKQRQPMTFAVQRDGEAVAELKPAKTAHQDVPLELASASAGLKPRTANEEVVTELSGELEIPAGRHTLLLIQRNVVDGRLERVTIER